MRQLNGTLIAQKIQEEVRLEVDRLTGRKPGLSVILVGSNPASVTYVTSKQKRCQAVGMASNLIRLDPSITQRELFDRINELNQDPTVDGILVQLPLPTHIDPLQTAMQISPDKDVDGLSPVNMGKLVIGDQSGFIPCTPRGILVLLERSGIGVEGKHVVILGRSNIVGKPLAALLAQKRAGCNATVTLAHSQTRDLAALSSQADILVAAIGIPEFVTPEMVKEGAVVVDVGMNRVEDPSSAKGYRLCGDVQFERVKEKVSAITPVPGGVGPLTIAMLLRNTLDSYYRREGIACPNGSFS
jgi:methylenetetrahydrofolate dehydrogenase (NADP+) / methenyltetrahydrofolate cyclohydrolase